MYSESDEKATDQVELLGERLITVVPWTLCSIATWNLDVLCFRVFSLFFFFLLGSMSKRQDQGHPPTELTTALTYEILFVGSMSFGFI